MTDWLPLALASIKRWEGCKLTAYLCPAGIWTIGFGTTGPTIKRGLVWTQAQADAALAEDVREFARDVRAAVKVPLQPHQMAALVSLAYNIGIGALRGSTLLRRLNAGDVQGACDQFGRWTRAGGRVLQGLVNRRADESRLFRGL